MSYDKAIELMRRPDTRMIATLTSDLPGGIAFYIVPGGVVHPAAAAKIKDHPLVRGEKDGLFPNHEQTWRMVQD